MLHMCTWAQYNAQNAPFWQGQIQGGGAFCASEPPFWVTHKRPKEGRKPCACAHKTPGILLLVALGRMQGRGGPGGQNPPPHTFGGPPITS